MQMSRRPRDSVGGQKEEERYVKRIKEFYIHVPTPHDKYNLFILLIWI